MPIPQPQQLLLIHALVAPPLLLLLAVQPRRIHISPVQMRVANGVPILVVAPVHKHDGCRHDERQAREAQVDGVTFDEARCFRGGIDVGGDEAGRVADCEEESHDLFCVHQRSA